MPPFEARGKKKLITFEQQFNVLVLVHLEELYPISHLLQVSGEERLFCQIVYIPPAITKSTFFETINTKGLESSYPSSLTDSTKVQETLYPKNTPT